MALLTGDAPCPQGARDSKPRGRGFTVGECRVATHDEKERFMVAFIVVGWVLFGLFVTGSAAYGIHHEVTKQEQSK